MGNVSQFIKHYLSPGGAKVFCCYCGKWLVAPLKGTREHIIPTSKGGNSRVLNLKPCCTICNNERGNRPLINWLAELNADLKLNRNKYDTEIKIENIKHIIAYAHEQGVKLYRNEHLFKRYKGQL